LGPATGVGATATGMGLAATDMGLVVALARMTNFQIPNDQSG
jgi:hypothetical protein